MPRFPCLRLLVPTVILASALVAISCGQSSTPTPVPPTATPGGTVTKVAVEMTSFDFIPEDFEFSVGETVEFELYSRDIEHDFVVEALGIDWDVKGEERETHRYTFNTPGKFRLLCTIPGHEAGGMIGEIVVR